jgi:glycerol-3-phosphate dehydrogenase subunit B
MVQYDIIIIGMGLSGLMAAKTAAEAGRKVLIIGRGTGSLCLFSNTIDLLGDLPKAPDKGNALSRWIAEHPQHPYSKAGTAAIDEAFASFISLFPPPYSFQSMGGENCMILTGAGTFRPTRLIPSTMVAATSSWQVKTLIVGFEGLKDFYSRYVADGLGCPGITLPLPETRNQEITASLLSRFMEQNSFRENIAREIRRHINGEDRVGFPAVLGLHHPMAVKKDLEDKLGTEVFEIPALPPSIPGRRIFNRFRTWLIQKGVTFLLGQPVTKVSLKGTRCEGVYVLHSPVSTFYSGARIILATGRFMGGGLVAERERIIEPIFNLPVTQPESREAWFMRMFSEDHPIHHAGIETDNSFRPVDETGTVSIENAWVAGTLLAHHNVIEEKSREGIELVTGYLAAKYALGTYG